MTEAKKINEGTVTSLSDTDLVLASDSSGTLRPITVANLQKLFRDTLQIGGRNLIVGSDKQMPNSSSSYQFTDGVHSLIMNKGGMGIYKPVGTYPIESYTISVELKADKPMSLCWYLANNESSAVSFAVTTEWKRYKATLKPTSGSLLFRITSYNEYETRFYARYPKIEPGNVATDWTPAPEDLGWGGG